jgi:hypothetical protein
MASAGHDLTAVIVGGALAISGGFFSNLWLEWRHNRQLRKNLALAFQGEITAIQEMVRKRGYIEGLKNAIRGIESSGKPIPFSFRARRRYFSVYEAHVG